ncbi:fibronectin type III domain-containing protein [Planctomyces sp. SH-PL62]|uniref:fibronectin type III domain-containing protein n=1 Tax=Planctomyces sp. SH-PL62 TaxID=1636152 RepID=UPI00078D52F4|nr:fibronectin type III domain-containing protein [Planctomyces sp. SH-PL62]AMV37363.1 hypothetical protein VT85_08010 [Planctomyces sp. SH-PL62]
MPQRSFEHWYRGSSFAAAAGSSTSSFRGLRGSLTTPAFRTASTFDEGAAGGLAAGGSAAFGLAWSATASASLGLGGASTSTLSTTREGEGGLGLGAASSANLDQIVAASGGASWGGSVGAAVGCVVVTSGGWTAGGSGVLLDPALRARSFAYWYRGRPVSNSLGPHSGGFGHVYRGMLGLPSAARLDGVAISLTGEGGLAFGGLAIVRVGATYHEAATATGSFGGAAEARRDVAFVPSGGWSIGGIGPNRVAGSAVSAGGLAAAGVSPHRLGATASAMAGATFGGRAGGFIEIAFTAVGGATVGGAATGSRSILVEATGGLAVGGVSLSPYMGYHIYINDGMGGPVDYDAPVALVWEPTWTSGPLPPGSSFRFAVRAYDAETGLVDENLDASVALILDDEGRDATRVPPAPIGLRVFPRPGGRARIEWTVAGTPASRRASHFNVYVQPDEIASYAAPTIVATAASARGDSFGVEVGGLTDAATYAVVVRAANATGEESNTRSYYFTADSAPPTQVDSLSAATSASVA